MWTVADQGSYKLYVRNSVPSHSDKVNWPLSEQSLETINYCPLRPFELKMGK